MKSKLIVASALLAALAAPVMADSMSASTKTSISGSPTPPAGMTADETRRWEEKYQCAERERKADGTCKPGVQRSPATGPSNPPGPGAVVPGTTTPPGSIGGPGNSGGK